MTRPCHYRHKNRSCASTDTSTCPRQARCIKDAQDRQQRAFAENPLKEGEMWIDPAQIDTRVGPKIPRYVS